MMKIISHEKIDREPEPDDQGDQKYSIISMSTNNLLLSCTEHI